MKKIMFAALLLPLFIIGCAPKAAPFDNCIDEEAVALRGDEIRFHKRLIAFDLDGTLTQHKTPIEDQNKAVLDALRRRYEVIMVGAGNCPRIYHQLNDYPITIVGNYGMQESVVEDGEFRIVRQDTVPADTAFFIEKTNYLREKYGYTEFTGESLEFHPSGMVTFALLGTKAATQDKLAFDPDKAKRRAMYPEVLEIFKDYAVYIGGSTSFDFAPKQYNKYDATLKWANDHGYSLDQVLFVGDDLGDGGGDSHVRIYGMDYIRVDDYRKLPELMAFMCPKADPDGITPPDYSDRILTPPAPLTPRINGPRIYGARPGAPFLFRVPTTGLRPMTFSAKGLPRGLAIDPDKGIITGKTSKRGTYHVSIKAENRLGSDERELRIVIGDKIALTPPLGWNSWNCWGIQINQERILNSARAMDGMGLADYGWSYVNIDDGWQGLRGGKYNAIQTNRKFTDMKALTDEIHAMGLKAGIYSGPWMSTYASHIGSSCNNEEGTYWWIEKGLADSNWRLDRSKLGKEEIREFGQFSFAAQDAMQWADWGFDYLKYDWNINDKWWLEDMRHAIDATGRDIVYSISNSSRITLGPVLVDNAECWRTTGDIRDTWESMSTIGFEGQDKWAPYRRPGHWPDADMMVVGKVGWGRKYHWTQLTPDEQFTHVTLWSILSSPMLLGCDMEMLDPFTLSLLCNNEVLDVNQDPLGFQGTAFLRTDDSVIYVKPLEDGSVAMACFNLSDEPKVMGTTPRKLGLIGDQTVRDLWRQQDIATIKDKTPWEAEVAPHGTVFVKLSPGISGEKLLGNFRKYQ